MVKAKIMIVEDESIVATDLQENLKSLGYVVAAVASSGEEAIRKAAETRPELVLMDVKLKGKMDGVEAANLIRDSFNLPVIYLTAYADAETLRRAAPTEPYGYLIKPFDERELHTNIQIALYKHEMDRKLEECNLWLSSILKNVDDAVIVTDANGVINFINPVAEALTGCKPEEALGKGSTEIFNLLDEETQSFTENPVMRAIRERRAVGLINQTISTVKGGTRIPVIGSATPTKDKRGYIVGVVVTFQDTSEHRPAARALRKAHDELVIRNKTLAEKAVE